MKKIFLVDDEIAIRNGIGKSIDWMSEGFVYCGDASDGEIALPLIEKHKPDIVITDIKMPFMDGLELSRLLSLKMPSTKIIILSGHDEFEYAREAMRIGVNEYCLKPVSSQDLLKILKKVSSQIDKANHTQKRLSDLENQVLQNKYASRDKFLYDICEGSYTSSAAIKEAASLNLDLISNYYFIIILEYTHDSSFMTWIEDDYNCLRFSRKLKEDIFIMKGESQLELEKNAEMIRERLQAYEGSHPDRPIIFGIGKIESRIQGISLSFNDADEEKSYSTIIHKYSTKSTNRDLESKIELHHFKRKDLIDFLKFGSSSNVSSFARTYSSYLENGNFRSPFTTYYFLMDFTITITHFLKEIEMDNIDVMQEINQLETTASWIRSYHDVLNYMEKMLDLVTTCRDSMYSKFSTPVEMAVEYIHQNYSNSVLSLQMMADTVNVSASYLSHLFSQETGQTFIEYLTNVRMERAKELLMTTRNKTYEIAYEVGYSDSHYFCRSFKKITGMTTKQFKNQMQSV
ncbi:response regulator [Litchfieldia salsa]|uniref:Two-component system, response regulator YesN n=1 Tax=Litchfieldia salsa TaxID=930152 RepID=A0A1H0WB13_9BACI|nr:response regulator [Litchfieldia salsa]SDP87798.1 two-component system, response regulator YesN [Litchfieldia salsa]